MKSRHDGEIISHTDISFNCNIHSLIIGAVEVQHMTCCLWGRRRLLGNRGDGSSVDGSSVDGRDDSGGGVNSSDVVDGDRVDIFIHDVCFVNI